MIKKEDFKIIIGEDGQPRFNVDIEKIPVTISLKRNITEVAKLYCKACNISLDAFASIALNRMILSMNYPKELEDKVDELLKDEELSIG